MAPREQTTEEQQVAEAPVVTTAASTADAPLSTADRRKAVEDIVSNIFAEQFGGEDGAPTEGSEPWNDMVREQVLEADRLEAQYRDVLAKKEHNRTLVRAFAGMGQLPQEVADYYYPVKVKRTNGASA